MKSAQILGAVMILLGLAMLIELAVDAVKARLGFFKTIDRKGD
jgi:hypothetical protein